MRRILVLAGVALVALAACTSKNPGVASPTDATTATSRPSSGEQVPGPGVPKVENPIDTTSSSAAPCTALTDTQTTEIFGDSATAKPDPQGPAGPACSWTPAAFTGASVQVIFSTADRLGLTSVYEAKGTTYKLFEVLSPIDGYPVVAYGTQDVRTTDGICAVAVGTSDRSTVDISIRQNKASVGHKDPCDAARAVAAKVLDNVRKG